MDSLTTPLLMNATEVRGSKGGRLKMLYDIDDQPSQRAYEIVLNIICEEVGSNVEPATLFLKVLALAERNKVDLSHWKLNRMPDWVKRPKLVDRPPIRQTGSGGRKRRSYVDSALASRS